MYSSCLFYDLLALFFFWKDFKYLPSISLLTFVLSLFLVQFNSFVLIIIIFILQFSFPLLNLITICHHNNVTSLQGSIAFILLSFI